MASSLVSHLVFSLFIVSIAGEKSTAAISPTAIGTRTGTPSLASLLSELGFQELAMAVPSLPSALLLTDPWSPPATLFAPSDDSIRTCGAKCSPSRILREHVVPGLFPRRHLSKLAFGTKLETSSPNRCLTVTTTASNSTTASDVTIFVDGVEVTRPDLYNDGKIVIHGIQAFIAPLSPFSCAGFRNRGDETASDLMDAIARLRSGGYNILAIAMRIKWTELVGLHNMTVFALDDPSIFGGGQAYIHEVRFHVVPNQFLMHSDLAKLSEGTVLPTLVKGENLVVTSSGGTFGSGLRINYAPIRMPDVVYNSKIVVHSLFFPFPHLQSLVAAANAMITAAGCGGSRRPGECMMAGPAPAPAPAGGHSAAAAAAAVAAVENPDRGDDGSL